MTDATAQGDGQYLRFQLGAESFACDILQIREILEYHRPTAVPQMPAFVHGVMNLRGSVVPVIDLAQRLGRPASKVLRRSCIIILQQAAPAGDIGMLVDEVHAVEDIASDRMEAPPQLGRLFPPGLLAGMLRQTPGFTLLLDASQLLAPDVLSQLAEAMAETPASPLAGDGHD